MAVNARGRLPRSASMTDRLEAARKNRHIQIEERNRLLGLLASLYDAHLYPSGQGWPWVLCIHIPGAGQAAWRITHEEADSELFAHLKRDTEGHWDGHKQEDRNARILQAIQANVAKKTPNTAP